LSLRYFESWIGFDTTWYTETKQPPKKSTTDYPTKTTTDLIGLQLKILEEHSY